MKKLTAAVALATSVIAGSAIADTVKIGYVTTLTTPAAIIGQDMQNGVNLAMKHLGGKAGPHDLEVIFADDGFAPDTGKQVTDRLVKQDNVDIVAGYIWSHVLLASRKSVLDNDKFLIISNAGPSPAAGKLCHEDQFSVGVQNDLGPMAMGDQMNAAGVKKLYIMAPNYAAGKDMVKGVERTFKGEIVGKDLTKWGKDAQLDFSAELAKAKASGAEAIWVFYPGAAAGAFIKQYQQAGLSESMPLYTSFTIDAISLPKLQGAGFTAALGSQTTQIWDPTIDNAANKKFVADFRAEYGHYPSYYGAQAYDTIKAIAAAVEAADGAKDRDAFRAAFKSADYDSVRGKYTYGNNNFPIQNLYLREFVEGSDGVWTSKIVGTVYEPGQDPYASECKLK